jgi:chaperonin cofactor prefoldin
MATIDEKVSDSVSRLSVCEKSLKRMKSKCEKKNETLRLSIETLERNTSDSLSPVTSRLSVCEKSLKKMKSKCEKQNETLRLSIETLERNTSDSFSPITSRLSVCETSIAAHQTEINDIRSSIEELQHSATEIPLVSPSKSLDDIGFPLKEDKSLDGIISHLTRKHGNVHDKGIVVLTSKSTKEGDSFWSVRNVSDLTPESVFISENKPGQWVCWDFREMRVRPTHYTIKNSSLNSWVIEGSLDGENWTEIDRQTKNSQLMKEPFTASFAVSKSEECRFIRLTQTDKNQHGRCDLAIRIFEFFGNLIE